MPKVRRSLVLDALHKFLSAGYWYCGGESNGALMYEYGTRTKYFVRLILMQAS